MQILDCTLRDGGYYTKWDFSKDLVDQYIRALNDLPIDYIEVGYRSPTQTEYYGKYFYLPLYELEDLRKKTKKKLVIILNEKDVRVEHLSELIAPIVGVVDMVRMAIDPKNIHRAIELAREIKKYGFQVGFNVMYMSTWKQNKTFLEALGDVNGVADCFYMVDSYGGIFPEDIKEISAIVKGKLSCALGFHGHDNLEMGLANSLTALEAGVEFIDATILGMGRGAGNLKMELLLSVLNKKKALDVDFNALEKAVSAVTPLWRKYEWGTSLPYMISGINSLPQKDVMEWVTTRFYSFNSIIQALENQKNKMEDNEKYPILTTVKQFEKVLIVGGGLSVSQHIDGIVDLLVKNPDILVIHASSKNAKYFSHLSNEQIFCLIGNEGHRLEMVFDDLSDFKGTCILPPYPRKMGTYVPLRVRDNTFELAAIDFVDRYKDAHTTLALQIALNSKAALLYVVGYDGYTDYFITNKEKQLVEENTYLFDAVAHAGCDKIWSLTPSLYRNLSIKSIYSLNEQ
ncbi:MULTISPECIES: aldolase catalytic domain-containing protein [Chitinophagaceae]